MFNQNVQSVKLRNNFKVHTFIQLAKVDYLFSTNREESHYSLLNVAEFGRINKPDIHLLIEGGNRIAIINNDTLEMQVYNIEEEELTTVLMEMG